MKFSTIDSTADYEEATYEYSPFVDTSPCDVVSTSAFIKYVIPAAITVVFMLDLVGNGLVLKVLISRRSPWHLADHYLFQLALSDLLLGLTLPFWAVQYVYGWMFGYVSCKLLGALFTINMYSSIFFLVSISVNRYFSIVHAVEVHKKQRPIHTILICIFIWGISFILSWHEFYFRETGVNPVTEKPVCFYNFHPDQPDSWRIALQLIDLTFAFIFPLIFMLFFYSQILCTLQRSRLNHSRRSQMVIVVLLLVFVFCWAPYKSLQLIDSLQRLDYIGRNCNLEKKLDIGITATLALGLSHVCINPIIYAFVGVKFRKEIYKVFKRFSNHALNSSISVTRKGNLFTGSDNSYSKIV
ncbi:C-X-C chemokine receptor type 3-2-like [Pseudophryne corroboree]|uniref:C-X-C chemokine receptor type 3-2-like n=1 Tax=Pseudophryne corroboree TaxID=495146 RepID=UPI0030821BD7